MEKAKMVPVAELAQLPWGGVVWCEKRGELVCGGRTVKYYDWFPVMLTFSHWVDGAKILLAGERYHPDIELDNIPADVVIYWDKEPDISQAEPGLITYDEALEIFNEYEKKEFGVI